MSAEAALRQVAAQRAALADRARAPWWAWALSAVAIAGVDLSQWVAVRVSEGTGYWSVLVPALALLVGAELLVARVRGVQLSAAGPAAIVPGCLFLVFGLLAGPLAVRMTANAGATAATATAIAAVVLAFTLAVKLWFQIAVRRDIRAGRVRGR